MELGRRTFLKLSATGVAACAMPAPATAKVVNEIPYRVLGKTGAEVSILGVGGSHIGNPEVTEQEAIRIVRGALDEGLNFLDNAWNYANGASEERMGKALKDGYRDKAFLMTKTLERTPKGAQQNLEDSLRRLGVDYIDLWQVHSVGNFSEDLPGLFESGLLDVVAKAKEDGKVKHVGFTGHHNMDVHLTVLECGFDWETIQMPLSCLDPHYRSFAKNVVPRAREMDLGVIAMKTLGGDAAVFKPEVSNITIAEALRYSMSLPLTVVVSGMTSHKQLLHNLEVAKSFKQMSPDEVVALLERSEPFGKDGSHEGYKVKA